MKWIVKAEGQKNFLYVGENSYEVQIGKHGFVSQDEKEEGDGKTPCGEFQIHKIYYRKDQIMNFPAVQIEVDGISENDGWCDDSNNVQDYNKFIKLSEHYNSSHENLWRDDRLYDVIVTIGYNDINPVPKKGSAIFIHVAHPESKPTAGCVALKLNDLLHILPTLDHESSIEIIGNIIEDIQ
jgi:L,D-peptidoglycan transpeptidase YkuD (ErfK/YbiS/YcfS/YnhG family)